MHSMALLLLLAGLINVSVSKASEVNQVRSLSKDGGEGAGEKKPKKKKLQMKKAIKKKKEELRKADTTEIEDDKGPPILQTPSCNSAQSELMVTLYPDSWNTEVKWTVSTKNTGEVMGRVTLYKSAYVTVVHYVCLPAGDYVFSITDSFGDGMCPTGNYYGYYDYYYEGPMEPFSETGESSKGDEGSKGDKEGDPSAQFFFYYDYDYYFYEEEEEPYECGWYTLTLDGEEIHTSDGTYGAGEDVEFTANPIEEWTISYKGAMSDLDTDGDEATLNGLTLDYYVGKDKESYQLYSRIYMDDCNTTAFSGYVEPERALAPDPIYIDGTSIVEKSMQTYDIGRVTIGVDPEGVMYSPYWTNTSDTSGCISFCVLSELYSTDGVSVSFSETVVYTAVNFLAGFAGFTTNFIELKKFERSELDQKTDYTVTACVCDENQICQLDPCLYQNSKFQICVTPTSTDVIIGDFIDVFFFQDGEVKAMPVHDGNDNSITTTTTGKVGVIDTRIISVLFVEDDPKPLYVTGEVKLSFAPQAPVRGRSLEEKAGSGGEGSNAAFKLNIKLEKTKSSYDFQKLGFGCVVVAFVVAFVASRKKKEHVQYVDVDPEELN